ncbi:hypothetical protein LJC33_05070 [Eubacteriales bacterium OttesenSCG-928-N13]|nr:hypothetical protein [Eubacteriales bacterium OttesenSCG-928-N13]
MTICIRGHEFEFDVFDLDAMERYGAAESALGESIDPKVISADPSPERLSAVHEALTVFFDTVLGEGSLSIILDGKRNPVDALDAYYDLRDGALANTQARAAAVAARSKIPDKYNPARLKK